MRENQILWRVKRSDLILVRSLCTVCPHSAVSPDLDDIFTAAILCAFDGSKKRRRMREDTLTRRRSQRATKCAERMHSELKGRNNQRLTYLSSLRLSLIQIQNYEEKEYEVNNGNPEATSVTCQTQPKSPLWKGRYDNSPFSSSSIS